MYRASCLALSGSPTNGTNRALTGTDLVCLPASRPRTRVQFSRAASGWPGSAHEDDHQGHRTKIPRDSSRFR